MVIVVACLTAVAVRGYSGLNLTEAAAIHSLGHGLHTFTAVPAWVDSAFHPPWDGKMSTSFRVE